MIKGIHHVSALTKSFSENHHFLFRHIRATARKKYSKSRQYSHAPPILRRLYRKPGTLLTFFEVPRIGSSYNERAFFGNITLGIPKGTSSYWKKKAKRFCDIFPKRRPDFNLTRSRYNGYHPNGNTRNHF